MKNQYRNTILEDVINKITGKTEHEEEMARLDALANKPAATNTLIYVIPVAALVIFGVIFAIVLKRKKSA